HSFNDLRMPAIESKAQKILSVRTRFFRLKIGRARQEQPEHFQFSMRRCRHYRRESVLIAEINNGSGIEEASRRFPILLRRRDQQWRAALPVASVWINAFHQT